MNNTSTNNSAVSPGYGYRLLDKDEILRDGDEWLNHAYHPACSATTRDTWVETKSPGIMASCWTYRRKLDVGTGYILVPEGSSLLEGDEFRTREGGWAPTWFAYVSRKAGDYGDVYRRKVQSVPQPLGSTDGYRDLLVSARKALAAAEEKIKELEACNIEAQHQIERLTILLAQAQADKCDAEESASFYRGVNMALRDDLHTAKVELDKWGQSYALAVARNRVLRDDNEGLRCHIEELRSDVYQARTECGLRPRDTFFDL